MSHLAIILKRKYKNLNAGERCAFPSHEAHELIKLGAAVEDVDAGRARQHAAAAESAPARELAARVTKPGTAAVTKD